MICFFFSSRRRHTRYWRDWSSDVCSSDLKDIIYATQKNAVLKLTGRAVKVDKRIQILVIPAFLSSQENMAHLPKNLNYGKIKSEYLDRKSTRLNSSHANISYAVFCLKKKNLNLHLSSPYVYL